MKSQFAGKKILLAVSCAVMLLMTTPAAQASTYTDLHSFTGTPDGMFPVGGLVADNSGNYYGTTQGGGTFNMGTIFQVTSSGTYTVLYSFSGPSGKYPSSGLIRDSQGALYGTTYQGGTSGLGTVFKLPAGASSVTVLHNFTGRPDGRLPVAGLVQDTAGNLYGTTAFGGAFNNGTVFKVDTAGNESVLYSFTGNADGAYPLATPTLDQQGNLYGVTTGGGANSLGTVFSLSPSGVETVLHSFAGGTTDGAAPYYSALVRDASGNLYGTTYSGGFNGGYIESGLGTAFTVSSSGVESVIYLYCSITGCQDGLNPVAGFTLAPSGILYGTAPFAYYNGSLYSLTAQGQLTLLYQFQDNSSSEPLSGASPYSPPVIDASGNLYGTTYAGGSTGGPESAGMGSIYMFVP